MQLMSELLRLNTLSVPIQGVQDCTCACPRSQAGTGKSTHIEIRDAGGTFSVSFNGVERNTIHYIGYVLHARTDCDVFPCVVVILDCNSLRAELISCTAHSLCSSRDHAHFVVWLEPLDPSQLEC